MFTIRLIDHQFGLKRGSDLHKRGSVLVAKKDFVRELAVANRAAFHVFLSSTTAVHHGGFLCRVMAQSGELKDTENGNNGINGAKLNEFTSSVYSVISVCSVLSSFGFLKIPFHRQ
jgi:hypothetical protein